MLTMCKLLKRVVRPEGFEPPTLCLEGRLARSRKSFHFAHSIENPTLRQHQSMCLGVPGCSHLIVRSLQKSLHSSAADAGDIA